MMVMHCPYCDEDIFPFVYDEKLELYIYKLERFFKLRTGVRDILSYHGGTLTQQSHLAKKDPEQYVEKVNSMLRDLQKFLDFADTDIKILIEEGRV